MTIKLKSHFYKWRYLLRYFTLLWDINPYRFMIMVVLIIISGLLPIFSLEFLRQLIESISQTINTSIGLSSILFWLIVLLLSNYIAHLLSILNVNYVRDNNEKIKQSLQRKLLEKTSQFPLEYFEESLFYNKLQRANQGIDINLTQMSSYLPILPSSLITGVGLLIYLGSIHIMFPIILVLGIIPLMIIDARYGRKRWQNAREQTEAERNKEYIEDLLTNRSSSSEIRLYNLQEILVNKWIILQEKIGSERIQLAKKSFYRGLLGQIYIPLTMLLVIAFMFIWVARGVYALSYLIVFIESVSRFSMAMWQLFSTFARLNSDLLYVQDIFETLDEEIEDEVKYEEGIEYVEKIKLEEVSFKYPSSLDYAVKNVNLEISAHETIALVGENGSGKTTLAKLILGLYSADQGRVLLNGKNIKNIPSNSLYSLFSPVFQDFIRYETTIKENIGYGNLQLLGNESMIKLAAQKSGSNLFINSLPQGYSTKVGKEINENGIDLSTGQWQKLAISRSYLKNSQVVILDEPTSSLDAKTEAEVYKQFRNMAKDKLAILISHRLGSATIADRIVVLKNGRIVEEGTHKDLLKQGNYYSKMYRAQAEWYVE